jgi:hypothetical protein
MSENTSELQGNDWFAKLKNPQNSAMDTARAEGGQAAPVPTPTDVDSQ